MDGRQHLEQFKVLAIMASPSSSINLDLLTEEARQIFELSAKTNTPVFSASSLRYASGVADLGDGEKVHGCEAFGPMAILDDFPGVFWYGIHSADVLFSKMGTGCKEVTVTRTEQADVIAGVWEDGRIGTLYGFRFPGVNSFGATVFTEKDAQGVALGTLPARFAAQGDPALFQHRNLAHRRGRDARDHASGSGQHKPGDRETATLPR